eukprot:5145667-Amphidinium_carterae.1
MSQKTPKHPTITQPNRLHRPYDCELSARQVEPKVAGPLRNGGAPQYVGWGAGGTRTSIASVIVGVRLLHKELGLQGHAQAEDPQNSSHPDNSKGSLARLAPIPGWQSAAWQTFRSLLSRRTVIFDGCVQHRATNPTAESTPLPPDEEI